METRVWSKAQEKFAHILALRGHEASLLKVTGNVFTLKKNLANTLEALGQGAAPGEAGGKLVETIDARSITKAEVDPGNGSLTLHVEGDAPKKLSYSTSDSDAGAILGEILARSGRAFAPTQEEIGVFEAILGPGILGAIVGGFWFAAYDTAKKAAAGEHVEAKGRRQGLQKILIAISETLGTNGTIAVGALLLVLIVGWASMRLVKRPERTVWRPQSA